MRSQQFWWFHYSTAIAPAISSALAPIPAPALAPAAFANETVSMNSKRVVVEAISEYWK